MIDRPGVLIPLRDALHAPIHSTAAWDGADDEDELDLQSIGNGPHIFKFVKVNPAALHMDKVDSSSVGFAFHDVVVTMHAMMGASAQEKTRQGEHHATQGPSESRRLVGLERC